MIELQHVTKVFSARGRRTVVADDISLRFPVGECVGLIGQNGAGKSTLLRMIAGLLDPDAGQILRRGSVSWPVGFQGSFHPDLTGAENTRFVARLYGVPSDEMARFAKEFSQLGAQFNLPFRGYSSGMRARLAFAVSMAVPFDTYLIDEITAVGDAAFREKCETALAEKLSQSGALVVTHSMPFLRKICRSGAVLEGGKLQHFDQIEDAITYHLDTMRRGQASMAS